MAGASVLALCGAILWFFFRPELALIDTRVSESLPDSSTAILRRGRFVPVAHEGRGLAEILRLRDGQRVVRFTDFETLDGPDVRVYLLGAADARKGADLERAGFLDLGALKGNIGDQNYAIPADADLSRYAAVSVWCRRFAVNFTTAKLDNP